MTFAQMLHRVLDHYFGDETFVRRDMRQIEKIRDGLRDEVWNEVFAEVWSEVPEELRKKVPNDGQEKIRQRILARRRPARGKDAATT